MSAWNFHPVIAAVRDSNSARAAAALPGPRAVFLLGGDIQSLPHFLSILKEGGKTVFAHIDLVEGVGRDASGVRYLSSLGFDGLISTRAPLVKAAQSEGMISIQRIFLLDSESLESGKRLLSASHAHFCEVMPGLVPQAIASLSRDIRQPLIAGGMITQKQDVDTALRAGAVAVSTSKQSLWNEPYGAL